MLAVIGRQKRVTIVRPPEFHLAGISKRGYVCREIQSAGVKVSAQFEVLENTKALVGALKPLDLEKCRDFSITSRMRLPRADPETVNKGA
jgi:hypothetical protein